MLNQDQPANTSEISGSDGLTDNQFFRDPDASNETIVSLSSKNPSMGMGGSKGDDEANSIRNMMENLLDQRLQEIQNELSEMVTNLFNIYKEEIINQITNNIVNYLITNGLTGPKGDPGLNGRNGTNGTNGADCECCP